MLLQAGASDVAPRSPDRLRAVTPTPFTPAVPAVSPSGTESAAPAAKQLYFSGGLLELPAGSKVTLSAPERAVLMSLRTKHSGSQDSTAQDSTAQDNAAQDSTAQDNAGTPDLIPLKEGMNVFKGQELGHFDDRELRSVLKINQAQLEVAVAEQNKKTEVIYAAESLRVAMVEHQVLVDSNSRIANTVSAIEVQRAALAIEQARANLDLQKYNLEEVKNREVIVRQNELDRTNVQIEQRKLIAAIDGVIVNINAAEGELIREGDPVLEIVKLDTLRVKVEADVRQYSSRDLQDKQAVVYVTLADGKKETFNGTVFFCSPIVKSSYTYEVFIEVQNRRDGDYWLLQPGRGDAEIVIPL